MRTSSAGDRHIPRRRSGKTDWQLRRSASGRKILPLSKSRKSTVSADFGLANASKTLARRGHSKK